MSEQKDILTVAFDISGLQIISRKDKAVAQVIISQLKKEMIKQLSPYLDVNRDQQDVVFLTKETKDIKADVLSKVILNLHDKFTRKKRKLATSPVWTLAEHAHLKVIVSEDKATKVKIKKFDEWTGKSVWFAEHLLELKHKEPEFVVFTKQARAALKLEDINMPELVQETDSGKVTCYIFIPPKLDKPSIKPKKSLTNSLRTLPYKLKLKKPVYRNLELNQP